MRRSLASGFTLLELTIVVFILTVISAFALPRFADLSGVELGATTRRLSQTIRYLYEEAALRGTVYGLVFDLENQVAKVVRIDSESGEFVEDDASLSRPLAMPEGVRMIAVILPSVGRLQEGVVPIYFYPEGFVDRAWIQLADRHERAFTLIVDPLRGRAEVADGLVGPNGRG